MWNHCDQSHKHSCWAQKEHPGVKAEPQKIKKGNSNKFTFDLTFFFHMHLSVFNKWSITGRLSAPARETAGAHINMQFKSSPCLHTQDKIKQISDPTLATTLWNCAPKQQSSFFAVAPLLYLFFWSSFCIYLVGVADRGSWVGLRRSPRVCAGRGGGVGWGGVTSDSVTGSLMSSCTKAKAARKGCLLIHWMKIHGTYLQFFSLPCISPGTIKLGHDPPWPRLLAAHTFQRWIRGARRTDANPEIDDGNMGASSEHASSRVSGGADSEKMMDLCCTAAALDRKFSLRQWVLFQMPR